MWLLCNRVHYISDKALQFLSRGHQVQVTLFAWSYAEICIFFMCILNCLALGQLNWSTTAIASPRTSQHGEAPRAYKRDENPTGGNALWESVTVATKLALRFVLWT